MGGGAGGRGVATPAAAALRAARNARYWAEHGQNILHARREAHAPVQGPFVGAMPRGFPRDAYLDTFESNPIAAEALFWATSGYWQFSDYRRVDVSDASQAGLHATLEAAINEQYRTSDAVVEDAMRRFHKRASPGTAAVVCASCCATDVPLAARGVPGLDHVDIEPADVGVLEFVSFAYHPDDPLFRPLLYTDEENAAYERPVPAHVVDSTVNRVLWRRYRRTISVLPQPPPDPRILTCPRTAASAGTRLSATPPGP